MKLFSASLCAAFLLSLIYVPPTYASNIKDDIEAIIFGPEFTFALKNPQQAFVDKKELIERMKQHLLMNQSEDAAFMFISGTDSFVSPNGWSFDVRTDGGVIEIKMNPMPVASYIKHARDIQDAIFVSAANEGLFPAAYLGGGHINLDADILTKYPMLLRNFIVDFLNHPELSLGVLSYDTNNALSPALLPEKVIQQILELISNYDKQIERGHPDTDFFLTELYRVMRASDDPYFRKWHYAYYEQEDTSGFTRNKHTAISFLHSKLDSAHRTRRIEIRSARPQASIDVWIRQIQLLKNRLLYLSEIKTPIPFNPSLEYKYSKLSDSISDEQLLNPPYPAVDILTAFYTYLTEAGESWYDHKDYLWPQWISNGNVESFENSDWFQEQEKLKVSKCLQLLSV